MKALKEKRISLRSLWRRGLVILSLFALVFASCGESSTEETSSGPRIVSISVKTPPANDQYYGRPVDLEGTTLEVKYANGDKKVIDDISKFTAYPRIVTGYYDENATGWNGFFTGMGGCWIAYSNFSEKPAYAAFDGKVWGIYPTNTPAFNGRGPLAGREEDEGMYDMGLHLTGTARVIGKPYYVDDDSVDLSGLALEADYFYFDRTAGKLLRDRKEVSIADVTWKIYPDYGNKNADGSYKGYIYLTAGEDYTDFFVLKYDDNGDPVYDLPAAVEVYRKGVTVAAPLDTVYTVKKGGIRLAKEPDLGDYFYWQPNTRNSWLDRLGDDAQLIVSYDGSGASDRTFYVKDLAKNQRIWYNARPEEGDWWQHANTAAIDDDFDIVPIQYPLTVKANPEPGIVLYYRGAEYKIPVDVYTTLLSVTAEPKEAGDIMFSPDAYRDNDVDNGLPGSRGLAALLNVKATYQAYNDAGKQADVDLKYIGEVVDLWRRQKLAENSEDTEQYAAGFEGDWLYDGEYIPYYEFNSRATDGDLDGSVDADEGQIENIDTEDNIQGDTTYWNGYSKWLAAVQKNKKDAIVRAVTVTHFVREFRNDWWNWNPPLDGFTDTTVTGSDWAAYNGVKYWKADGTLIPEITYGTGTENTGSITTVEQAVLAKAARAAANRLYTWYPVLYSYMDSPYFAMTLVKRGGQWVWVDTQTRTGEPLEGIGLKAAKAKKAKISVTWVVKG